jgi:D-sedoheptulose 7-phosphate isomerase
MELEMFKEYIENYLEEVKQIVEKIDKDSINDFALSIKNLKNREGRLFIIGVGGSAANASHAVNDFRKLLGIETYSPLDNVSELTARINDDGWDSSLSNWLKTSRLCSKDSLMVMSVGGGSETTSKNLVNAMLYAKESEADVISVVSRDGGYAKKLSKACVLIPVLHDSRITPHAEEWQGVIWHMVVSAIVNSEKTK